MRPDDLNPLTEGLRVAPTWRRPIAGLINLAAVVAPVASASFAGYKLRRFLGPPLRPLTSRVDAWAEAHKFANGTAEFSLETRTLIAVVSLTLELDSRNRRSLGDRAMRIQPADIYTGGPVSVRSALVGNWALRAIRAGLDALAKRTSKRSTERMQALQPEIKKLQRAYAGDKAAEQEAVMRLYRDHNVNPFASCLPALLLRIVPSTVLVLFAPRGQNLVDRLAGVVWVVEDPGS